MAPAPAPTTLKSSPAPAVTVALLDPSHRLDRFGPAYMRWVGRHLPKGGTSAPRLCLLGALRERGPMPMRALQEVLTVSAQNVSVRVDGLEGHGLIAREHDPDDRKIVRVKLTTMGRQRVDAGLAAHQRAVGRLFACLDDEQKKRAGAADPEATLGVRTPPP